MSEEKKVKCHLCGQTFNTIEQRDEHNKQVHPTAYRLSHLIHGDARKETE